MPGRGFPRYTLCAGSIGTAHTNALDGRMFPLDQRRGLVNAAAISIVYLFAMRAGTSRTHGLARHSNATLLQVFETWEAGAVIFRLHGCPLLLVEDCLL